MVTTNYPTTQLSLLQASHGWELPNYKLFEYEKVLAQRELLQHTTNGHKDTNPIRRSAFWHSYRNPENGCVTPTYQYLLEAPATGSKRKNSTYLTHGIHRYKGKFYPQLAKSLLNLSELSTHGALVLDPFGGSGTVLLESVINGWDAVSIDCNPLATSVAQSKVDILEVDIQELSYAVSVLLREVSAWNTKQPNHREQFSQEARAELESWFAPVVLDKIGFLLHSIREIYDQRVVAFCEVILSDIVREVSHQEPRDLRTRRRKEPMDDAPVVEIFTRKLAAAVTNIKAYHTVDVTMKPIRGTGQVILGNSAISGPYTRMAAWQQTIDCVVSSPPYATALPYIDTDRLSLAAIYGMDSKSRKDLEKVLIGSRETTKSELKRYEEIISTDLDVFLPASTVSFLQGLLLDIRTDNTAGFRKQQLPTVLCKYFMGISDVLSQVKQRMTPGGNLWFVVGDSRTTVHGQQRAIPTVNEFSAIASHLGFEHIEDIHITVTRENMNHSKNAITQNTIVHLMI